VMGYMESHDEERLAFKNISYGNSAPYYNIKDTATNLKRLELAAAFFFTIPGPKMIWQFGELGYDYSINYPTGTSESRLAPKPIRWDYLSDWRRKYTEKIFSALIDLKKTQPVFATATYTLDVAGVTKRIWLRHNTMDVTVLGNFDVNQLSISPNFTKKGMWYEFFTGDSLNVADTTAALAFKAGEYRLYTTVKLTKPSFTAIDENRLQGDKERVIVYPNPSNGLFNFMVSLPGSSGGEISVYNSVGKIVKTWPLNHLTQDVNSFVLDLTFLSQGNPPAGIYFYRLDAGTFHSGGKLIVE
jgi:hypothetical protein